MPVPACADFTPETPFQKSLTAPGGAGLFVLRIWVKIVRCFAYVGTGKRYFRKKGGGRGSSLNHFISPSLRCTAGPWGPPPTRALGMPEEGAEISGSRSALAGAQGDVSWGAAA